MKRSQGPLSPGAGGLGWVMRFSPCVRRVQNKLLVGVGQGVGDLGVGNCDFSECYLTPLPGGGEVH